jgi:hypothetical protein
MWFEYLLIGLVVLSLVTKALCINRPRPVVTPGWLALEIIEAAFWIWGILHFWGTQ